MSFNKRTKFIYKAKNYCYGFSIRRENWKHLLEDEDHQLISGYLKQSVKLYYEKTILNIMKEEKLKAIEKWQGRADYQCMIAVRDNSHADRHCDSSAQTHTCDDEEDEVANAILKLNSKLDLIKVKNTKFFKSYD